MRTIYGTCASIVTLLMLCVVSRHAVCQNAADSAPWQTSSQPPTQLSLAAEAVQTVVQSGAAITIKVASKNVSTQTLNLWMENAMDQIGWVYKVDVRDEKGTSPPDTKLGRIFRYNEQGSPNIGPGTLLAGSGGFGELRPGETLIDIIDVSRLYDFSKSGHYTIQVQRSGPNGVPVKSNPLIINVTPSQNAPLTESASAGQLPFSLTIAPAANPVRQGSPIGLRITTTNITDRQILLWTERAREEQAGAAYEVVVLDDQGLPQAETDLGRRMKNRTDVPRGTGNDLQWQTSGEKLVLKPGESWKDTIMINDLFNLREPGEYKIYVQRFDPATKRMVKSNSISVTVASATRR